MTTQTAADFMAAAPKAVNGNTPWASRYAAEIRRIWAEDAAQDPRTLQSHLGPSELGVECDRQVAGKLIALAETNHVLDPWPSTRGRGMHAHAAERVFPGDNERSGVLRWITEQRVTPHPEHPGTADLYDAVEQAVVDHKFLGQSSMAKMRKEPPRKYVGQLMLYGLGYHRLCLPVKRIVILAYPATAGSLNGLYVWEHRFTDEAGRIAPEVLELITEVFLDTARRKAQAAEILAGRLRWSDVPAAPDDEECYFCPFYRPQAAKDPSAGGCPGPRSVLPTNPGSGSPAPVVVTPTSSA